ncbi:MAG: type II secretion system protein [Thiobacillus sp.]
MYNKRQRGLTLIELLVFIVIIGIAANAMLAVFANLTRTSAGLLPDKQAQAIANGVMQEILAQPFASIGSPYTPNIMLSGNPALAAYLPVNITYPPPPVIPGIPANKIRQVTVTVNAPNGVNARFDGIRFDY